MKEILIRRAAKKVKIYHYLEYRGYLRALYDFAKSENPDYTHETFANELRIPKINYTSGVITGLLPLTTVMAEKIGSELKLSAPERHYLVLLAEFTHSTSKTREDALRKLVDLKQKLDPTRAKSSLTEMFSEWYHIVIFEMVALQCFEKLTPAFIKKLLLPNIRPMQVEKSISLLKEMNLIQETDGRAFQVTKMFDTGPVFNGFEVDNFHYQMIDVAKDALALTPPAQRDFSSLTVAVGESEFTEIKRKIHQLQDEILALSEKAEEKTVVYQVNMQLFPMTKRPEKKRSET